MKKAEKEKEKPMTNVEPTNKYLQKKAKDEPNPTKDETKKS